MKIRTKHNSNKYTTEFSTNFSETDVTWIQNICSDDWNKSEIALCIEEYTQLTAWRRIRTRVIY